MRIVNLCLMLVLLASCQKAEMAEPPLTLCRADQIKVTAGEIDAAMGHRNMPVTVKLNGQGGCILPQWPQISVLPEPIRDGVRIEQSTDGYFASITPQGPITLTPSQTATFYMGWGVIPHEVDGETVCPEVSGWKLKTSDGSETAEIATQIQACGQKISVSAFSVTGVSEDGAAKPSL